MATINLEISLNRGNIPQTYHIVNVPIENTTINDVLEAFTELSGYPGGQVSLTYEGQALQRGAKLSEMFTAEDEKAEIGGNYKPPKPVFRPRRFEVDFPRDRMVMC